MKKIIFLFLIYSQISFASFNLNSNIERSYSSIMNLEFDVAKNILEKERNVNPENGFILLHENYIDFLTIIINEDFNYFNTHKSYKSERLASINNTDNLSPYFLYSKAEINLQWAFARLKFGQYAKASIEILNAYRMLEENKILFPEFNLNNKGLGLLHTLLGAIPDEFSWILNMTNLNGDIALGIHELDLVLNDTNLLMYEQETLFIISFLRMNLDKDKSAYLMYLQRIGDRYKENILLNFTAARLSYTLGQNDKCIKILSDRPSSLSKLNFYYLDYLQAMAYMYKLDLHSAKKKFRYFLTNYNGNNYVKSAYHKLALISFLQNNQEETSNNLNNVVVKGTLYIDEDKVSFKDAQENKLSHPFLIRSRLLYDGGYYYQSLSEIKQFIKLLDLSSLDMQAEYWYRLARIYSKLDYDQKDIFDSYNMSLEKGVNSKKYYAPMSALQIALIYEDQNNLSKAKHYFKSCISMSGFDYQRGIHQKAKAGLNRISN